MSDEQTQKDREAVLDKIRKALALTSSPNKAEAEAAMAMVQRLLVRYDLTLQDLAADKPQEGWAEDRHVFGFKGAPELAYIATLLEAFFSVTTYRRRAYVEEGAGSHRDKNRQVSLQLIGRPHHVEVARHVCAYLSRAFRAAWTTWLDDHLEERQKRQAFLARFAVKPPGPLKPLSAKERALLRDSFFRGMMDGIAWKLREAREGVQAETGLVLVEERPPLPEGIPVTKKPEEDQEAERQADAYGPGVRAGVKTSIHTALGGGSASPAGALEGGRT